MHHPQTGIVQRGEYTEKMAVKFIKQIVEAVKFVHKHNVVHRDVKVTPLTILLSKIIMAQN